MYHTQGNSFSMLFGMGNRGGYDEGEMYAAPAVDCTLSLGTPSTRRSAAASESSGGHHQEKRRSSSYMSSFGWNILQPSSKNAPPPTPPPSKGHRSGGGDPLLARRCANCDTTSTPLWRNGPRGPKSLCNACGIRFKKEERRATAAASTGRGHGGDAQQYMINGGSWSSQHHLQKTAQCYPSSAYGNEFRFTDEDDAIDPEALSGAGSIPFVSWRFNVRDKSTFVHDFTR